MAESRWLRARQASAGIPWLPGSVGSASRTAALSLTLTAHSRTDSGASWSMEAVSFLLSS